MYYAIWVATIFLGCFLAIDVVSQVLSGHFKYLFRISSLLEIVGFASLLCAALILRETKSIRLHLHGDHFYFEGPGEVGMQVRFSDIARVRFSRHKKLVPGFYMDLKSGKSIHIPLFLERVDYIMDALKFYRPELCASPQFVIHRKQGVLVDHLTSHYFENFSRSKIEGLWLCLLAPLVFKHEWERLEKDPTLLKRDTDYEKSIKIKYRKIAILASISLVSLCVYDVFRK